MKKILSLAGILLIAISVSACTSPASKESQSQKLGGQDLNVLSENNLNEGANGENANSGNIKTYSIVSSESKAQYSINEVLKGVPTLVVGTSSQITGDITVDTSKPAKISIGEIKLDAESLKTDIDVRDQNIIKLFLKSNLPENKYIVFKASDISGVPEELQSGQAFPVKIMGDLSISGTTKSIVFEGMVTWNESGSLEGTVSADLNYANFGLTLPDFPFFTDVDEIAKLKIDLSAR